MTGLNIVGEKQAKWTQNWLTAATVLGLLLVVFVGIAFAETPTPVVPSQPATGSEVGLVMIFVLLTYGGWNEAAYISAELRDVRRNMVRSLLWGIGTITAIYLLINLT